jgi:hypothetical protein
VRRSRKRSAWRSRVHDGWTEILSQLCDSRSSVAVPMMRGVRYARSDNSRAGEGLSPGRFLYAQWGHLLPAIAIATLAAMIRVTIAALCSTAPEPTAFICADADGPAEDMAAAMVAKGRQAATNHAQISHDRAYHRNVGDPCRDGRDRYRGCRRSEWRIFSRACQVDNIGASSLM